MNSSAIQKVKDPAPRPEDVVAGYRLHAFIARRDDRRWSKVARFFQRLIREVFLEQDQSAARPVRERKDWD